MPIYEYQCHDCKQIFEEWQKDFQDRDIVCPVCRGKSQRIMSNTSFVLKGSGWYVTDYCGKHSPEKGGNGSGDGNGKDAVKTETKTEVTPSPQPACSGGCACAKPA